MTTARRSLRRCPLTTADENQRLRRLVAETRIAVLPVAHKMHIVPLLVCALYCHVHFWSHAFDAVQKTTGC